MAAPRLRVRCALLGLGVLAAGCSTLPQARPTAPPLPQAWIEAPEGASPAALANWWTAAGDPTLDSLIAEALTEGPTAQRAALRLQEARALARQTIAINLPIFDAQAGGQYTQVLEGDELVGSFRSFVSGGGSGGLVQESTQFIGSYGPRVSWEIPLFARVEAARFGARATAAVAEADIRATAVALAADVADAYIDFRAAQNTRAALQDAAQGARELARITQSAAAAGFASPAEAAEARRQAAVVEGRLPSVEQEIRRAATVLGLLRGRAPGTETQAVVAQLAAPGPVPSVPFGAAPAAPADLLRLRPDVARAEAQALQQAADLAIARVDRWPGLRLQGSVTANENLIGQALSTRQVELGLQPAIVLPLFDWGQRQAAVRVRDARFQQALIAYRETVNQAAAEASSGLTALIQGDARLASAREAEAAAEVASRGAQAAYGAGLQSLADRIRADQQLIDARLSRIDAEAARARAAVSAYRAFGGGPAGSAPPG